MRLKNARGIASEEGSAQIRAAAGRPLSQQVIKNDKK